MKTTILRLTKEQEQILDADKAARAAYKAALAACGDARRAHGKGSEQYKAAQAAAEVALDETERTRIAVEDMGEIAREKRED